MKKTTLFGVALSIFIAMLIPSCEAEKSAIYLEDSAPDPKQESIIEEGVTYYKANSTTPVDRNKELEHLIMNAYHTIFDDTKKEVYLLKNEMEEKAFFASHTDFLNEDIEENYAKSKPPHKNVTKARNIIKKSHFIRVFSKIEVSNGKELHHHGKAIKDYGKARSWDAVTIPKKGSGKESRVRNEIPNHYTQYKNDEILAANFSPKDKTICFYSKKNYKGKKFSIKVKKKNVATVHNRIKFNPLSHKNI